MTYMQKLSASTPGACLWCADGAPPHPVSAQCINRWWDAAVAAVSTVKPGESIVENTRSMKTGAPATCVDCRSYGHDPYIVALCSLHAAAGEHKAAAEELTEALRRLCNPHLTAAERLVLTDAARALLARVEVKP